MKINREILILGASLLAIPFLKGRVVKESFGSDCAPPKDLDIVYPGFLNDKGMPRGLKNNNPGNINFTDSTWVGKLSKKCNSDPRFEQFWAMEYGVRAWIINLQNAYLSKGLNTIEKIIPIYAPLGDGNNNPSLYIKAVKKDLMGVGYSDNIVFPSNWQSMRGNTLNDFACAIFHHENGSGYGTYNDYRQYFYPILDYAKQLI